MAARVLTALAALLVLVALGAPDETSRLTPGALVRIPAEGLLGAGLLVVLPARARQVVAGLSGALLGLLTLVKLVDLGFDAVLARPFNVVLDWILFGYAMGFLTSSIGRIGAIGALVALALLAVAVILLMTRSVLRLTRVAVRHTATTVRAVAVLALAWFACAGLGAEIVPGVPVAATATAGLVYDHARQVPAGLRDQRAFARDAATDAFRTTPGSQLLTGLRGKDVIISFVESYGRSAVEDPDLAPQVDAVLDAGTRRLNAAGFASRSAFLTSSTAGGGSWLAHSTLLSGVWINNQQRYHSLVASSRLTLTGAFRRAGWRTVSVEPAVTRAWPEGAFFGYDKDYDFRNLGYRGPRFSYSLMPDQYTFAAFRRAEHAAPERVPVMAEITLTSSHIPWTPTPRLLDWNALGDGSVFGPMAKAGDPPAAVWRSRDRIRAAYRSSIEYSLNTLISYVQTYGDDHLVLVFLGDHQPARIITGASGNRDVPITIVAHDRAVLDRISGWGWQDGLRPGPHAPVWRMDTFRDRFLTAFGH